MGPLKKKFFFSPVACLEPVVQLTMTSKAKVSNKGLFYFLLAQAPQESKPPKVLNLTKRINQAKHMKEPPQRSQARARKEPGKVTKCHANFIERLEASSQISRASKHEVLRENTNVL